jgi:hypothetical protein
MPQVVLCLDPDSKQQVFAIEARRMGLPRTDRRILGAAARRELAPRGNMRTDCGNFLAGNGLQLQAVAKLLFEIVKVNWRKFRRS